VELEALSWITEKVFPYFTFFDYSISRALILFIFSIPFLVIPYSIIINEVKAPKTSLAFYTFASLLYYFPGVVVSYVLMNHLLSFFIFYVSFIFHSIIILIQMRLDNPLPTIRIVKVALPEQSTILLLILTLITGIIITIRILGFPKIGLWLGSGQLLYEVRGEFKERMADSSITAYLTRWIPGPLAVFSYSFSLRVRNFRAKLLLLLLSIGIVYNYSQYRGQKAYMLIALIMIGLLFNKKFTLGHLPKFLPKVLVLISGISFFFGILSTLLKSNFLFSVYFIVRRALITPSQVTVYWIDFFKDKQFELWSYLFSKSADPTADIIGSVYMKGAHINAGFIADGYANFGVFGVFMNVLLISSIYVFLDKQLRINTHENIGYFLFLLLPMNTFVGTRPSIVILSGGVLFFVLFALFGLKLVRTSD